MGAIDVRSIKKAKTFIRKSARALRNFANPRDYKRWVARYDTLTVEERRRISNNIAKLSRTPIISVIMPVSENDWPWLFATLRSLQAQLYPYWELCLISDGPVSEQQRADLHGFVGRESRIRVVFRNDAAARSTKVNAALLLASGDAITLIDAGDVLPEHALYWVAKEILTHPDARLIFSDEDKIDHDGIRIDPWFKPDWNPALMLSYDAFGRLGVYERALVESVSGFRHGFDGNEEYDLALRCSRAIDRKRIRHIPRVLYHRRLRKVSALSCAISKVWETGCRAITDHLVELGLSAEVRRGCGMGYQVRYEIPSSHPRVSVLVPTTARPKLLEPCIDSLLGRTRYDEFEVLLLANEAELRFSDRAALLKRVSENPGVQVLAYPNRPFNYSWVSNWGARQASGDILCFLNDDTEVISGDWLEHLVARVLLPGVAAAGPMLYYSNDTIQHAGVVLGFGGVAGHACHMEPRGAFGYFGRACLEQDVSCVTAACMVIRREVFHELRGFDEELPVAYNDVDFCLRVRKAEWRIIWTPLAELYHHESASLGRHNSRERAEQFSSAVALMRHRWGTTLDSDPFYNRNLSLVRPYALAFPPR
jgi:GT2 family glycosyltransferase